MGITPNDVYDMTYEQIYLLTAPLDDLKHRRTSRGTPQDLRRKGILPPPPADGQAGMSLFQRIRAKTQAAQGPTPREQRRARRAAAHEAARAAAKARAEQKHGSTEGDESNG